MKREKLDHDFIKINFDRSKKETGEATVGFVMMNHLGKLIHLEAYDSKT